MAKATTTPDRRKETSRKKDDGPEGCDQGLSQRNPRRILISLSRATGWIVLASRISASISAIAMM